MIAVVSCLHYPDDERIYHREIKTLVKGEIHISYFSRSESNLDLSDQLISHINFQKSDFSIRAYKRELLRHFLENKPKILHIHEPELLPLAKMVKRLFDTKVIYDVHEDYPSLIQTFSRWGKLIRIFQEKIWLRKEKQFLSWVDEIILASPAIINSGYKENGFIPVVMENFPSGELIRMPDLSSERGNTIIYHGHLGPERGITELIKSMVTVSNTINDVTLSLFGSFRTRKYEEKTLTLIDQLNLHDHVKWYGHVPHEEIWNHLARNAIGVIPFIDNPLTNLGTPTKLFEFMAAGCRIVASDLPPMQRYEVDGLTLVKPGDVKSLADHLVKELTNETVIKLQVNQRKIVNEYNWEAISHRLVDVYKKLMVR